MSQEPTHDTPDEDDLEASAASRSRDFLKHARNYLSASLVANVAVAVSFPLLTYLLTPEDYGVLSIFSSLVSLLTILFLLNVHSGVSRYYLEGNDDFGRALGSNLLLLAIVGAVLLLPLLAFAAPIAGFFSLDTEVLVYAVIAALLSVLPELYLAYLSAAQESRLYAVLSVLRTVVALVLMIGIILALDDDKYLGKIFSQLAVLIALSVIAFRGLHRLASYDFHSRYIRYTLRFSLPLIPHSMSRYILGYFDRIQINQITNASDTGLYAFAYDVGMAMSLIVIAAGRAWRPIFIEEYGAGNVEKLDRMVKSYANQIYLAGVAIMLFAGDLVLLFVEARFHAALPLIPLIVLSYVFVFLYTLYFQYASFRKRTELISISTLIAGAANIALNYAFIPLYGYHAAAYTTLASFALLCLLHYINARFILRERVLRFRSVGPGFFFVIAITVGLVLLERAIPDRLLSILVRLPMMALAGYLFYWKPRQASRA